MELLVKHFVPEYQAQVVREYVRCVYDAKDESDIRKRSAEIMDTYLSLGGYRELDKQVIRMSETVDYFKELRS